MFSGCLYHNLCHLQWCWTLPIRQWMFSQWVLQSYSPCYDAVAFNIHLETAGSTVPHFQLYTGQNGGQYKHCCFPLSLLYISCAQLHANPADSSHCSKPVAFNFMQVLLNQVAFNFMQVLLILVIIVDQLPSILVNDAGSKFPAMVTPCKCCCFQSFIYSCKSLFFNLKQVLQVPDYRPMLCILHTSWLVIWFLFDTATWIQCLA